MKSVDCCGSARHSKFCPDCGRQLRHDNPLLCLLAHCNQTAKAQRANQESWEEKAREENQQDWEKRGNKKRSEAHGRQAEKWENWARELSKLIDDAQKE